MRGEAGTTELQEFSWWMRSREGWMWHLTTAIASAGLDPIV